MLAPFSMPKNNKKGKAPTSEAACYFDDMLAELRAADLTKPTASINAPTTTSSSSSSSSSSGITASNVLPSSGPAVGRTIPEEDMVKAVHRGDLEQMKRWARQGVRAHTAEALRQAAASGKVDAVQCLVQELGVDVNEGDEEGYTPLYAAVQEGRTAMARYLVKGLCADVDRASKKGHTPLINAAQNGHLDISCCFIKELDADVNKANGEGFTPLLLAIQEGHLPMVRSLIEALGADIKKVSHDGRTPLMVASYGGHTKIVHVLIKHGADSQVRAPEYGMAADISKHFGATVDLTAYLEAKMHCSNTGCSGAGIKKCTGCKHVR
jgi:ankyrin repeat protein